QGRTGRRVLHSPAAALGNGGESSGSVGPIIGGSEALRNAAEKARLLANLDVPVLLQVETGVGEDMIGRTIHESGRRRGGQVIALNCGGLPRDIVVSEPFGYVDAAFTGAR